MADRRKDNRGRNLKDGEMQEEKGSNKGRYKYQYMDCLLYTSDAADE